MNTDNVARGAVAGSQRGRPAPSVAVLGGGVGGMSAAHELVERGFRVTVYEAKSVQGGQGPQHLRAGHGVGGRRACRANMAFVSFPRSTSTCPTR
jgi:hypothetical protein